MSDTPPLRPQPHTRPETVATPEGDNEFTDGQPLAPAPECLERTPAIDTNKL